MAARVRPFLFARVVRGLELLKFQRSAPSHSSIPSNRYTDPMSEPRTPIVMALGGNAISREGEVGDIPEQFARTAKSAAIVADLVSGGVLPVLTHGNGPQVGQVLRRVELAVHEVYPLPLDICVADTQGGMGYMIAACLNNELQRRRIPLRAAAMVTTVVVDANDPAFQHPTKPIGAVLPAERAAEFRATRGWTLTEIPGKGVRRVVASPRPCEILEIDLIRRLVEQGELLIVGGGGGVPVVRDESGYIRGVEAVIDKDLTSALIARGLGVSTFVIATGIDRVALDFRKPTQRFLNHLSLDEARRHLEAGQFPSGSMGPKIAAGIDFLEHSPHRDAAVIICDLEHISRALAGSAGTRITH